MRIHLFCSENSQPGEAGSVGRGLRARQILHFLQGLGHDVTVSVHRGRETAGMAVHDDTLPSQLLLLQQNQAQAAYYSNPMRSALTKEIKDALRIKVFFDIQGPSFVEEARGMSGGEMEFLIRFGATLALADEVTVIADSLVAMAQTALAAVGKCWQAPNIVVLPLAVEVESLARNPAADPLLVCTASLDPWRDPSAPLEVIARGLEDIGRGTVLLLDGPHNPPHRESGSVTNWLNAMERAYPRFRSIPFVPPQALRQFYAQAWAVVDLAEPSIGNQMAFDAHTWEQLALGLPILCGGGKIGALIAESQAGWTVDPADGPAIAKTVEQICSSREEVIRRSGNASAMVDRYLATWRAKARFRHL